LGRLPLLPRYIKLTSERARQASERASRRDNMIHLHVLEIEKNIDDGTQGFSLKEFREFREQVENYLDSRRE
jgi:hypothetical protein